MKAKSVALMKICTVCRRRLPLTNEYRSRSGLSSDGFYPHCKDCVKKSAKDQYRKFTKVDVIERGEFGVKCVLWSPKCSVCPCVSEDDLSACWRIANIKPESSRYPIPLNPE